MTMTHGAANTPHSTQRAAATRVVPQHRAPLLPVVARHAFRVLQTAQAPAQMSLFLGPGTR